MRVTQRDVYPVRVLVGEVPITDVFHTSQGTTIEARLKRATTVRHQCQGVAK